MARPNEPVPQPHRVYGASIIMGFLTLIVLLVGGYETYYQATKHVTAIKSSATAPKAP